jgi:membrane carboxypeptidase/penicillin-binding protein
MPQSAFRNLVNTQFTQKIVLPDPKDSSKSVTVNKKVAKAYLTYEEVFNQMVKDLCDEEVSIFMAYLVSYKFPTREEQVKRCRAAEKRRAKKVKSKMLKEPIITVEDIRAANNIDANQMKPVYWNLQTPEQVTEKIKLKVIKNGKD